MVVWENVSEERYGTLIVWEELRVQVDLFGDVFVWKKGLYIFSLMV
jgi:hypothetical protein